MSASPEKRGWNVGRELSPNYEWFDHVVIGTLMRFDTEEELRTWIKTHRVAKGSRKRTGSLGATLIKLLDKKNTSFTDTSYPSYLRKLHE